MNKFIKTIAMLFFLGVGLFLHTLNIQPAYSQVEILGNSMEPTIVAGNICEIDKNFPFEDLNIGDVILYRDSGMVIFEHSEYSWLHRIVGQKDGGYIMRGDNNDRNDPFLLTKSNYIGKMMTIKNRENI